MPIPPEARLGQTQAAAQASQATLDGLWATLAATTGITRADMLAQAASSNTSAPTPAPVTNVDASQPAPSAGSDTSATNTTQLLEGATYTALNLDTVPITAPLRAQMQSLENDLAQGLTEINPGSVQVANGATIYSGYQLVLVQGGSTILVVPSSQVTLPTAVISAPSSQITAPSSQVLTPSAEMTSLNLRPTLCRR